MQKTCKHVFKNKDFRVIRDQKAYKLSKEMFGDDDERTMDPKALLVHLFFVERLQAVLLRCHHLWLF